MEYSLDYTLNTQGLAINIDDVAIQFNQKPEYTYKKYFNILQNIKNKIPMRDDNLFSAASRYTNPLELVEFAVHRNPPPQSRAYFKMWEVLKNISDDIFLPKKNGKISSNFYVAHLAEGPGGFIDALDDWFKSHKLDHGYQPYQNHWKAITLKVSNQQGRQTPQLQNFNMDNIYYGPPSKVRDPTGDITCAENAMGFIKEILVQTQGKGAEIITADGGFEREYEERKTKTDLNDYKEFYHQQLFFGEIVIAISCQAKGGTYIMKTYGLYQRISAVFLYILGCFYEKVQVVKPKTSRVCNDEKYLICSGYKERDINFSRACFHIMHKWTLSKTMDVNIFPFLKFSETFEKSIKEMNKKFTRFQTDWIIKAQDVYHQMMKDDEFKKYILDTMMNPYHIRKNNILKNINPHLQNCMEDAIIFRNIYFNLPYVDNKIIFKKLNFTSEIENEVNVQITKHKNSSIFKLKHFHNFIKQTQLSFVVKKLVQCSQHNFQGTQNLSLLDLCCGRGGDINKWENSSIFINPYCKGGIRKVIGVDIDSEAIQEAQKRLKHKYIDEQLHNIQVKWSTLNLLTKKDLDKLDKICDKYCPKFNIVSCFFAFHYFFESQLHLSQILENISNKLVKGGYFIGTFIHGQKLLDKLMTHNGCYKNEKMRIELLEKTNHLYGNKISFSLQDTVYFDNKGSSIEYLIFIDDLKNEAQKYNLKLTSTLSFEKIYNENYINSKSFKELDSQEKEISFLYYTFYFEKL